MRAARQAGSRLPIDGQPEDNDEPQDEALRADLEGQGPLDERLAQGVRQHACWPGSTAPRRSARPGARSAGPRPGTAGAPAVSLAPDRTDARRSRATAPRRSSSSSRPGPARRRSPSSTAIAEMNSTSVSNSVNRVVVTSLVVVVAATPIPAASSRSRTAAPIRAWAGGRVVVRADHHDPGPARHRPGSARGPASRGTGTAPSSGTGRSPPASRSCRGRRSAA